MAVSPAPTNLEKLAQWLAVGQKHLDWDGKIYVASTISWNSTEKEFQQVGCSPNYHSKWWSLACCKHDMRTARPFRNEARDLAIPTYVFTLGRNNPDIGQPLVSVARVTKSFETMQEYADFLIRRGHQLSSSRLTRVPEDDGSLGRRFGDCHSDRSGVVGAPNSGHVHRKNGLWREDTDGQHLILVSSEFLVWDSPVFVAKVIQKQSRYGTDISLRNLRQLLCCRERR